MYLYLNLFENSTTIVTMTINKRLSQNLLFFFFSFIENITAMHYSKNHPIIYKCI